MSNGPDRRFAGFGMELATGMLRDRAAAGLLTAAGLHAAVVQIIAALLHVHQRGIAHLDVKSENVLVRMRWKCMTEAQSLFLLHARLLGCQAANANLPHGMCTSAGNCAYAQSVTYPVMSPMVLRNTCAWAQMCEGAPGSPAIAKLSDWGHALFLGAEPTRVTTPDWYSPHMRFLTALLFTYSSV